MRPEHQMDCRMPFPGRRKNGSGPLQPECKRKRLSTKWDGREVLEGNDRSTLQAGE